MRLFQYLRAIFESFYSAKLYQDVALGWKGRGFLYLFFLMLIATTIFAYSWYQLLGQTSANEYAQKTYSALLGDEAASESEKLNRLFTVVGGLPALTVENSELESPTGEAVTLYDPLNPSAAVIHIDAKSATDHIEATAPVILARDGIKINHQTKRDFVLYYHDFQLADEDWNRFFATLATLPLWQIEEAVGSMPQTSPHIVYNVVDEPFMYFDEHASIQTYERSDASIQLAFLKDGLIFFETDDAPKPIAYDQLTKQDIVDFAAHKFSKGFRFVQLGIVAGTFVASLLIWAVAIAITSLLAFVMRAMAEHKHVYQLSFKDCQRLSAIAFTPALVTKAILPGFPLDNLLYFIITLGYIYFAVIANKKL